MNGDASRPSPTGIPCEDAQARCTAALEGVIATRGIRDLELEFRLGRVVTQRGSSRFDSDVTQVAWTRIMERLSAYKGWDVIVGTVSTDYLLPHNTRHSVYADLRRKTITKQRLTNVEVATDRCFDIRMSLSTETTARDPGSLGSDTLTRRKRRTSFRHRCWAIELTSIQSNATDDLDCAITYEVEVELLDNSYISKTSPQHVVEWGLALCEQLYEMISHD